MKHSDLLISRLSNSVEAFSSFIRNAEKVKTFSIIASQVAASLKMGGRLYIAGNGGSAADAQHLAAEFVCRFGRDRNPLPAEALTVDTSTITAIGNDYGFAHIFSRQLKAKMRKEDFFLAITTSGGSDNILEALRFCKEKGYTSAVLTGKDGGAAASLAGICLIADGKDTGAIQELHLAIEHSLCACVENELLP